jgi:hypothetical protein
MKKRSLNTILLLIGLLFLVGLACRSSGQVDPTATVELVVEPEPVVEVDDPEPEPTHTMEPILPPVEEDVEDPENEEEDFEDSPQIAGLEYFIEEFDSDPGWYYEVVSPSGYDPESVSYTFDFGRMNFDIPQRQLYAYYLYEGASYENVRLDINFENRGVNSMQVSLICQMGDEGWYEWAVQSDGLWRLYAVQDGYNQMAGGGSKFVNMGKEVNEYTLICEGNELSFFINGVEPTGSPHVDRKYSLRRGEVGFSISSLQATPVKVEVDWFAVSQP